MWSLRLKTFINKRKKVVGSISVAVNDIELISSFLRLDRAAVFETINRAMVYICLYTYQTS